MPNFILLGVFLALATAETIDLQLLNDIFGEPLPTTTRGLTRPQYDATTMKAPHVKTMIIDRGNQGCKCLPYYLCDANHVGVHANNVTVTGHITHMDLSFAGDTESQRRCTESVEICCTIPKKTTAVTTPKPKPIPGKVAGCGYRNPQGLGVTFTGGTGAECQYGEFPWVVALLDSRNLSYAGVGVLINAQVVMTGAHIAKKYPLGTLKIRAGEWDTQTVKEIYDCQERNVQEMFIHENFYQDSYVNDIALLLLDQPVEISQHINVICMPEPQEVFDGYKNCVTNRWGKNEFGRKGLYSVIMKKVEQDIVPYSRCSTLLRLGKYFHLKKSFICAGGEEGKNTRKGDGGAPLACPIGNNRYKLAGLVSWGIGCGQKNVPTVYTNVPLFRQWVNEKMGQWGLTL